MKTFRKMVALSVMVLFGIGPALAVDTHQWSVVSSSTIATYAIDENNHLWSWNTIPVPNPEPVLIDDTGTWSMISTAQSPGVDRVIGVRDGQIFEATNAGAIVSLDSGSSWASVSSGHTAAGAYYVAKKDDGTLWAWGSNDTGQLGHSGVTLTPTQILDTGDHSGHSWTTVSTAKALGSVAALRDDGTLWVWGSNPSGELGVGIDPVVEPTQIIGNWSSVVLNSTADGSNVAILALDADGALYSWGLNADGRLGTGAEYAVLTAPALVDAGPWEKIAAAPNMNVSYGIKNDGTLWSWGIGIDGMAGQGEVENNFLVPTQIAGFNDWVNVVVGDGHIFGQRAGIDFLYAWGNQFRSIQIDPVSPDEHFVPTEVAVWSWSTPTSTVASAFPDGAPFDMQPNHFYLQLNN